MGRGAPAFEATIVVEDLKDPEAVYKALLPEAGEAKRFRADIELDGNVVTIKIVARDPTALRAALNSYLRLLRLLEDLEGL
ncbi:MAG: hypothetical protein GXO00_02765 [Candidatus Diapherotrites archaeon]|nr:hypothetical protein [Candidatus Diapherotrites archaeon]